MTVTAGGCTFPFLDAVSPDLEGARLQRGAWLAKFANQSGSRGPSALPNLHIPEIAARYYPFAVGTVLDIVTDMMGWFFVFDDILAGPVARNLEAVVAMLVPYLDSLNSGSRGCSGE